MATHLLTPSPSPPPTTPLPSLWTQINTATKQQHLELNRLIMRRLPLSLPPNASSPEFYGHGLAVFARIYYAFEAAWLDVNLLALRSEQNETHAVQVLHFLSDLRPYGLDRTARLKEDIKFISHRTGVDVESTLELELQDMLDAIIRSISEKPHVLIAYGWVLYMAIFSGGRWIRQRLSAAGFEFWTGEPDVAQFEKHNINLVEMPGFSFLSFDCENDGEDTKASFKAQIAKADSILTQQERQEVVQAAQELFDDCFTLVEMLDHVTKQQIIRRKTLFALICAVGLLILLYAWKKLGHEQ